MRVKITSDSTCDLSQEIIEKYDIYVLPLYVSLGAETRRDGVEVSPEDIYSYVRETGKLPTTSAPNIGDYLDMFRKWRDEGFEVVHYCISGDFSSACQNAQMAAEEIGGVSVVDSRNLSTGQGLVVLYGAEMAQRGASADEIKRACDNMVDKVEASFVVDSIDYLYKGGRCSALAAFGANLLKLKPCIEVIDGKMKPTKKYRGNIDRVILSYVDDKLKDRTDIDTHRIFITHTACNPETVKLVSEKVKSYFGFDEIIETTAGCTVTSHCGPNTLGVLFIRK